MSILDKYGIKEVADITFYEIEPDGSRGAPVLYLDTLKISNIEQTAEVSEARGGKGNSKIIVWDHSKEINITIEDALISPKALSMVYGNGQIIKNKKDKMTKIAMARAKSSGKLPDYFLADIYDEDKQGRVRKKVYVNGVPKEKNSLTLADAEISIVGLNREDETIIPLTGKDGAFQLSDWTGTQLNKYENFFITYEVPVSSKMITVTPDSFPGIYYVVGETFARSNVNGEDEFFQFIIPKAKLKPENTLSMEADGEPSTFSMNLTALKNEEDVLMELVQYKLTPPFCIYGVPSETGNIGLRSGDSVTYYDGVVLPTLPDKAYQYSMIVYSKLSGYIMWVYSAPFYINNTTGTVRVYTDKGAMYQLWQVNTDENVWNLKAEGQTTSGSITDDTPIWTNEDIYAEIDGIRSLYIAAYDPIPVGGIVDTIDGKPIYEDLR